MFDKDTWVCNSRFINFKISRWLGKKIQFIKLGKFWPHGSPLVCIQSHLDEWIYALITLIVNLELSIDNMRLNGNFWTSSQTWDDETCEGLVSCIFFPSLSNNLSDKFWYITFKKGFQCSPLNWCLLSVVQM